MKPVIFKNFNLHVSIIMNPFYFFKTLSFSFSFLFILYFPFSSFPYSFFLSFSLLPGVHCRQLLELVFPTVLDMVPAGQGVGVPDPASQ